MIYLPLPFCRKKRFWPKPWQSMIYLVLAKKKEVDH